MILIKIDFIIPIIYLFAPFVLWVAVLAMPNICPGIVTLYKCDVKNSETIYILPKVRAKCYK